MSDYLATLGWPFAVVFAVAYLAERRLTIQCLEEWRKSSRVLSDGWRACIRRGRDERVALEAEIDRLNARLRELEAQGDAWKAG